MPSHVKFLLRHAAIGLALAVLSVAAILYYDFAGLGTLIAASDIALLAVLLLTFMLGLTLASVQMGIAIMLLPYDKIPPSGRKPNQLAHFLVTHNLVPIRAETRPQSHQMFN